MDDTLLLAALKTDLGIRSQAYDERLADRLDEARSALTDLGIVLQDSTQDRDLVVMYAAWLWRSRLDGSPMPPMLKQARNNRLFGRKARTDGAEAGS